MKQNYQKNTTIVSSSVSSLPKDDSSSTYDKNTGAGSSPVLTFADLNVAKVLCKNLEKQGITTPFPIQQLTLPLALKGRDVIGQAKTGTGKTLGFALPLLTRCLELYYAAKHSSPEKSPAKKNQSDSALRGITLALIMLPTRELAQQVHEEIKNVSRNTPLRVGLFCGGHPMRKQIQTLRRGCEVAVGTPGRLLDLLSQNHLYLDQVEILVLDEADEMLDLGFLDSVESLIKATPVTRQSLLFSATMPAEIIALSKRYLRQAIHVQAREENTEQASSTAVKQLVYRCHPLNKAEVTARILQARNRGLTIIFTPTKRKATDVAHDLKCRGFAVAELHGDLKQITRDRALAGFRKNKIDVLVATDVAARGIDVEEVTHVINYQCPDSAKTYIHRVGRTGRAGKEGIAITFVDWEEVMRWKLIAKELKQSELEPVETYHTSPHLYTDLDIPASAGANVISKAGIDELEINELETETKIKTRSAHQPRRKRLRRELSSQNIKKDNRAAGKAENATKSVSRGEAKGNSEGESKGKNGAKTSRVRSRKRRYQPQK